MQDLVDCTGVNRGSLYATYGDKNALFVSALRAFDERRRYMLGELERRYAPREAIRKLFGSFIDEANPSGGNRGCFMKNTALELAAHDVEIRNFVATGQEDVQAFFLRMIKLGKAEGEFGEHVKPQEAACSLLASLLGLLVLVRSWQDRAVLQSIVSDAVRRLE